MKKMMISLSALTLSLLLISGCTKAKEKDTTKSTASSSQVDDAEAIDLNSLVLPQLSKEVAPNEDLVELVTSKGNIKIKLFPEIAPKAVENFMTHAKAGYYKDVTFHRIIKDFMIQSGDPEGTGGGGASIWEKEFAPEISNQLYHIQGALAMARTQGDVTLETQGSQFYIVNNTANVKDGLLAEAYPEKILAAYENGGAPFLDQQYSVFGQVIEGLDVVAAISAVETDSDDKPSETITIKEIKILQEAK